MGMVDKLMSLFNKPSGFGGRLSTTLMNVMNKKQYDFVFENLHLEKSDVVLDIGFGNGKLLENITNVINTDNVYGCDISQDMVELTKTKGLQTVVADVCELPYMNKMFSKVYTINTIYFWNNLKKGLSEINRVLHIDGIFINSCYYSEWANKIPFVKGQFNSDSVDEIIKVAEECGFTLKKFTNINDKSYGFILKKVEDYEWNG